MSRDDDRKATRARIVAVARGLFATEGYAATRLQEVQTRAGLSRGALYHHFQNKRDLFDAVYQDVEADVGKAIAAAAGSSDDDALRAGCLAWLDLATDPEVRQITLIDAPAVLGWDSWSATDDRRGLGLLRAALEHQAALGRLDAQLVDGVARVLLAALIELGLTIARADSPEQSHRQARDALDYLLTRLLAE
jgi:AcrR family transcriptional regulator